MDRIIPDKGSKGWLTAQIVKEQQGGKCVFLKLSEGSVREENYFLRGIRLCVFVLVGVHMCVLAYMCMLVLVGISANICKISDFFFSHCLHQLTIFVILPSPNYKYIVNFVSWEEDYFSVKSRTMEEITQCASPYLFICGTFSSCFYQVQNKNISQHKVPDRTLLL